MFGRSSFRAICGSLLLTVLTGFLCAGDQLGTPGSNGKALDKQIRASLPKVINTGADLFNEGDRAGCYRLYQGSLLTLRPLLEHHPDLQKAIDNAMADADQQPTVGARAFALRSALDKIREKLRSPDATAKPGEKPAGKPETLWDRLGGEKNVRKVVDDLVALAAKDPKVNFDRNGKYKFDPVKLADFKEQMVDFISAAAGGPLQYTGKSMKEVHKGMGITTAEFNALAADLRKALEQNGARRADVDALLKAVEATRKDIVEGN
jgi:hemoglobin